MPAYHDIDGEPAHASSHLLTKVLRKQWGFDGLVVADYVGISLLHKDHGVAMDPAQAVAMAFNAGLDVELPNDDCVKHLGLALERGQVSMAKVDEVVARILTEKFRLGLFECTFEDPASVTLRTQATLDVALEVARQSIVVLENNGILPLPAATKQRIAVIGPCAADPMAHLSGYSFPVHVILQGANEGASHVETPLQGLRALFTQAQISYAQGCKLLDTRSAGAPVFPGDVRDAAGERAKSPVLMGTDGVDEAVQTAKSADVAIVCVGDLAGLFQTGTVGEGSDTDSLRLPGVQQQLLESIVATGTPTIVILSGGRPYNLGGLEDQVAAFLMTFTGGQKAGQAIAEVLAGVTQPSGRMTISVPTSAGAAPYFYNHKLKSAGAPIAFHFGSRYPFGSGKSYTMFEYSNLSVETPRVDVQTGNVVLTMELANVGAHAATEVVQVYVRDRHASVVRPLKELKAFQRVHLEPQARRTLRFTLPVDMLCLTDHSGKRVVEPGWFDLMVGASSANILLRSEFEVIGSASRTLPHDWRMQSQCDVLAA